MQSVKKNLQSYISFTRTERLGLLCLCSLLVILITIRATMHFWVHPASDPDKDRELAAAWAAFKEKEAPPQGADAHSVANKDFQDAGSTIPLPDTINLNTADSSTLVQLKGIGPATAKKIIARRTTKGPFTDVDQLKEVGSFSSATFDLLKRHLGVK